MRLLDLFCGAGGAGEGYRRAGFTVTGVDNRPMPRYKPGEFIQADALEFLAEFGGDFDVIHASPVCHGYSSLSAVNRHKEYPDQVPECRELLQTVGKPWIIENVPGAPLIDPITLCGSMFDLEACCDDGYYRYLRRHRLFESSEPIKAPGPCRHGWQAVGVHGSSTNVQTRGDYHGNREEAQEVMGIDWMTHKEITQAIPPAYTEWLGRQLI